MPDWITRAQQLGREPTSRPTLLNESGDEPRNEGPSALQRQTEFGREIARGAISSTLMVLAQTMGDRPTPPTIEQIHRRMIKIQTVLAGHCVVVNVLLMLNGDVRLTCVCGLDGCEQAQNFDLSVTNESISAWLGECIVDCFERVARMA